MLKQWYDMDLYHEMLKRNEGKPVFNLHDGPPFSNGMIHMGTALNKCLKDFITRYKAMSGYNAIYYPGWDNHGMPIESAIIKEQKLNHKEMTTAEFRDACHEFAQHYVDVQRDQFKRLGCLGEWDHPYLTIGPEVRGGGDPHLRRDVQEGLYLPRQEAGLLVPARRDSLAEAEIEYAEDPASPSTSSSRSRTTTASSANTAT